MLHAGFLSWQGGVIRELSRFRKAILLELPARILQTRRYENRVDITQRRGGEMIELRTEFDSPLSRFVDCFWYSSGDRRNHRRERLLPTGRADLIFKLQGRRRVHIVRQHGNDASAESYCGAVLSGAHTGPFAIDASRPSPTVGVHFRPGGAAPFLGIPLALLMDRHVPLEEIWGRQVHALRQGLIQEKSVPVIFDMLEKVLVDRFNEPTREYFAMMDAVQEFTSLGSLGVKQVIESTGFRSKRFIRLFHDSVGLTPKLFCRIHRFQAILDRIVSRERFEWVNLAIENGYYDQSHLIRDFRAFTGVTPTEYEPVEAGRKNHMVLP